MALLSGSSWWRASGQRQKKLAEKARAWQYINLVELLPSKPYCVQDEWSLLQQAQADGQVVLVQSMEQLKRSKRDIADILSWVEAFTTLIAINRCICSPTHGGLLAAGYKSSTSERQSVDRVR